ncbi:MAG: AAA family ATPase [Desulfobacterales bacterium]|nr:AAA family ATPase [Desulfobacterales bacterium]MBF0397789.1 AAA family ATPase [Desulfobacterales bacterium]
MNKKILEEIETLVKARYPLIAIETYEEVRAEKLIEIIAKKREKKIFCWSITRGLFEYNISIQSKKGTDNETKDPMTAMDNIISMVEPAIFILKDFHPYLSDHSICRKLRELAQYLKGSYKTVVLISPKVKIPMELEKDMTLVDLPLPNLEEIGELLDNTICDLNENTEIKIDSKKIPREQILKAALGLTLNEIENVFAKSLVRGGRLTREDIPVILSEKEQIIKKSGILEYYSSQERFEDVGGLEILKGWLSKRRLAFTEKAKAYGLPFPKGVLILGVQGCGKSLCAKAVSSFWQMPLLRFDVGKVFSSLMGSSEENIRKAISVAESVAPAILWIDEIEKSFAGIQGSGMTDGGTTARVFGNFLTWLQEKTSPVFVLATANNISLLPPELLRKGRFDEIFFVDLPTQKELEAIIKIHLEKRKKDLKSIDILEISKVSKGYSGAEIEQAIISGLFESFEKQTPLTTEIILKAIGETVPLSTTMKEDIESLKKWADTRARRASSEESELASTIKRKYEF